MLQTTIDAIRAILATDPSLDPAERARVIAAIRQKPKPEGASQVRSKVLQRSEVARMLSRSVRFVDRLAQRGTLRKVRIPGMQRAIGFAEKDVLGLLAEQQSLGE